MNILLSVPTFESVQIETFSSIYNMNKGSHNVDLSFIKGYDCASARNMMVQQALDLKYDYIFMVDSDIILPEDALLELLHIDEDIAFGYYPTHKDGCDMSCTSLFKYVGDDMIDIIKVDELAYSQCNKLRVYGGGMGCALIKTDIFNKLEYPWFNWVNYTNGLSQSEDMYFCSQCYDKSIPIYTNTDVMCGHISKVIQSF